MFYQINVALEEVQKARGVEFSAEHFTGFYEGCLNSFNSWRETHGPMFNILCKKIHEEGLYVIYN